MKDSFKETNSIFERYPKTTIFFIVAISIVVLDVLLTNTYNYFKEREREREIEVRREIRILHPVYHHTFKKSSKSIEDCGNEYTYTLFTNSLGFKDRSSREVPLKSTNHRILFIGDSFTEGICLNYDDTFVGIIDATLSKKQIEVLNAGRVSYSPIIYWRKIKYLIQDVGLQFDEVVVFIDLSDVANDAIIYELSDNMNVISDDWDDIPDESPEEVVEDDLSDIIFGLESPQPISIKDLISQNTTVMYHTMKFFYDSLNLNKEEQTEMEERQARMTKDAGPWSWIISSNWKVKWTIDKNAYNEYGNKGVVLNKEYMDRLLKILRGNGIDLTIAVYPWPSQVWYEDLNSIQVNIWKKWSQENNVKFINYFPDFVEKGLDKTEKRQLLEKYYLPGDPHFNNEGNQLIARKFIKTYLNEE